MIRNNLKIALRNFYKKPVFSIINVLGLAIGIACFVLTMLYVNYELSYDNFHQHKGRIYLVTSTIAFEDTFTENQNCTPPPLAEELRLNYPEVLTSTRMIGSFNFVFENKEELIKEENIVCVDSSFFDVFSYEFIEGTPNNALNEWTSMVITESIANKYFGDEKVYGKILKSNNVSYKVTGVIKDPPPNSVIRFNMLISSTMMRRLSTRWNHNRIQTYVVIKNDFAYKQLEKKFPSLIKSKIPQIQGQDIESWLKAGNRWEYHLISLNEIYLDMEGNRVYILGFSIVAFFLLIIACINYMNLSTARASMRAKEVGVRLTFGASRKNLIRQFLSESILMSLLSMIIGMGIVEAFLPTLSGFIEKDLSIHYFDNFFVLPSLFILAIIIGSLSGTYPAFVLSSFKPVFVLKGQKITNSKGFNLRNILVFIQFSISIILIISLFIVFKQSDLLYTKDLGYNMNNLLILKDGSTKRESVKDKKDIFKAELLNIPGIENVAFSNLTIPHAYNMRTYEWKTESSEAKLFADLKVSPDFCNTMKLEMLSGRFFRNDIPTDSSAVVINEAAVKLLNCLDPIGLKLNKDGVDCHIIGIVKDFYFEALYREIKPLVLQYHGGKTAHLGTCNTAIRYKPENLQSIILEIKKLWKEYVPLKPFEYYISKEQNETLYRREKQTRQLIFALTLITLLVTLIGLFGLATFSAEVKLKEIAIRKTMGASVLSILLKLSWPFTKLVLMANIIAWPLAWYFMNDWLNGFATRITISWWIFILAALLSYLLAIITIVFQAYSAAHKNPVDVLRYE